MLFRRWDRRTLCEVNGYNIEHKYSGIRLTRFLGGIDNLAMNVLAKTEKKAQLYEANVSAHNDSLTMDPYHGHTEGDSRKLGWQIMKIDAVHVQPKRRSQLFYNIANFLFNQSCSVFWHWQGIYSNTLGHTQEQKLTIYK
jgi:hypothetical protein